MQDCIICLENASSKMPCCNAFAHTRCLDEWRRGKGYLTCPACRHDFSPLCVVCNNPAQNSQTICCFKPIHRNCFIHAQQVANLNKGCCPICKYDKNKRDPICHCSLTFVFLSVLLIISIISFMITGIGINHTSVLPTSISCYLNRTNHCLNYVNCGSEYACKKHIRFSVTNGDTLSFDHCMNKLWNCRMQVRDAYTHCDNLLPWIHTIIYNKFVIGGDRLFNCSQL